MVGGEIVGDDRREVREFSRIQESSEGALALWPIKMSSISRIQASVVLVQKDLSLPDRTDVTISKWLIPIKASIHFK